MIRLHIPIFNNRASVEIEGENPKDLIKGAEFWQTLPNLCPMCNAGLYFRYRKTKEGDYEYYEILCTGAPQHRAQLGQSKKGGGLFLKKEAWEVNSYASQQADDDIHESQPPARENGQSAPQRNVQEPQNAPGTKRGEMIAKIKAHVEAIQNFGRNPEIDVTKLGGMTDSQLIAHGKRLREMRDKLEQDF